LVATDTLINGTDGVDVKTGIGDTVEVGESVGSSGVMVGEAEPVTGTNACAVCVAPIATTVCAIIVPRIFASGVATVTTGVAQARDAISRNTTDKRIGFDFDMFPPFGKPA
jgi:hypothetical protein